MSGAFVLFTVQEDWQRPLRRLVAYIELTRPVNASITFVSVWVAALLAVESVGGLAAFRITLGALAAMLIAAAGNVHNDVCDIEVDRVNRPDRPLPRNLVSVGAAGIFALVLATMGVVMGALLGWIPFMITMSAASLLFVYNIRLKMTVLWGNAAVSLLTGMAFIFGAVLAGRVAGGIFPAVFSLFFHFSRELVKDMQDYAGDKIRAGATFAQCFGLAKASRLSAFSLAFLFIIVPIPYFASLYNINYLIIAVLGVEFPLIWVMLKLMKRSGSELQRVSTVLKTGMALGLIALYIGR